LDGKPVSETITIAYLPLKLGIAYPLKHQEDLRLEARITFWSAIIAFLSIVWLFSVAKGWHRYRNEMKSY